jgi:hypothetical protein
MTYGLMFKVTTDSEKHAVVSAAKSAGLHVYPDNVNVNNDIYVVLLFAGTFSTVHRAFDKIKTPIYVYNGELVGGRFDPAYIRSVRNSNFADYRYSEVPHSTIRGGPATCHTCGDEVYDGHVDTHGTVYCNKCVDGWVKCQICHARHPPEELEKVDGFLLCYPCYETEAKMCSNCGSVHLRGDMGTVDRQLLCMRCIENPDVAMRCSHCGNVHLRCNMRTDGHIFICSGCSSRYATCTCGRLMDTSSTQVAHDNIDGSVWCEECARSRQFFGDYRYRPRTLKFFSVGSSDPGPYIGWEIEMCRGNRQKTLEALANVEEIFCKRDGSLCPETGIEMVSHPCTFDYYMTRFPWDDVLKPAIKRGYVSHNDERCGLHIHIDRAYLGESPDKQDINVLKIAWALSKFWRQFARFSRRSSDSLKRWAARYEDLIDGDVPNNKHIDRMKRSSSVTKHMCVNLNHRTTIELRFFRGSLNLETILASIQMAKVLADLKDVPLIELYEMEWPEFFARCSEYKELMSYMERRNISADHCGTKETIEDEHPEQVEMTVQSLNELLGRVSRAAAEEEVVERTDYPDRRMYIRR